MIMIGENVEISHVTVDDDIGSYWSVYWMMMTIIYLYIMMKCMYAKKNEHFLKLYQDEVFHVLYSEGVSSKLNEEVWEEGRLDSPQMFPLKLH